MEVCQISSVPLIFEGRTDKIKLLNLLNTPSKLSDELIEGIYLRKESEGYLQHRAKIVRADFIQTIDTHWMHKKIEHNTVLARTKI